MKNVFILFYNLYIADPFGMYGSATVKDDYVNAIVLSNNLEAYFCLTFIFKGLYYYYKY